MPKTNSGHIVHEIHNIISTLNTFRRLLIKFYILKNLFIVKCAVMTMIFGIYEHLKPIARTFDSILTIRL